MRGIALIMAYLLGNEKARNWCMKKICEASLAIEKSFKETQPKKSIEGDKKNGRNIRENDE